MDLSTSDMALIASLIAAFVGTGAMTISSASEAAWTERGDSPAPGQAVLWPLTKLTGFTLEGKSLYTFAVSAHWGIGVGWGIAWWLLIAVLGLNLLLTTVLFYAIVWGAAILMLKVSGIAPWPWRWGIKYNLFDWTHHAAYVGGVLVAWVLVEQIAQGL